MTLLTHDSSMKNLHTNKRLCIAYAAGPGGYLSATVKLDSDKDEYARRQTSCHQGQELFFDESRSWRAVLERIVREADNG